MLPGEGAGCPVVEEWGGGPNTASPETMGGGFLSHLGDGVGVATSFLFNVGVVFRAVDCCLESLCISTTTGMLGGNRVTPLDALWSEGKGTTTSCNTHHRVE